jgi:urea transport system permease protein
MQKTKKYWPVIILSLVFLIAMPAANKLGYVSDTTINLWGRYFSFAILALGIDLIWGFTGILSLCQAFFFCLGGYAVAMHMLLMTGQKGVYGSALPDFMVWNQVEKLPIFWEPFHSFGGTIILALLIPALFAFIFGYFAFRSRIKGVYFAIITQALAFAMWLIFLRNETMLGGTNGLTDFKTLLGFELSNPDVKLGLYIITFAMLLLAYFLCKKIIDSKLGKVLIAVRDSEHRLRYTGYSVTGYKLFIFVFAALLGALGGILYVPQTGIVTPGSMDVQASIEMLIWVAVGGRGSLIGAIIGAVLVNMLYSITTSVFPGSWLYILGVLFIVVVLFYNQGIVGLLNQIKEKAIALIKGKTPEQLAANA